MITKEQYEELITDYEKFNSFLNIFAEQLIQRVYLEVPELVMFHIKNVKETKKLRDKFYEKFEDLKECPQLLAKTVNALRVKNPDWEKEKLYEEAGQLTRKLRLEKDKTNAQGF